MPLNYDPAFLLAIQPLLPQLSKKQELPTVQNVPSSRKRREAAIEAMFASWPDSADVSRRVFHIESDDGHQIPVHAFTKTNASSKPGPAMLHYHAGGLTVGSAVLFTKSLGRIVNETSIPIYSVDYRLAPEHTGTTPVEDCYAALVWLSQNAEEHGVDPARIAVFGESAGGGMAAGVALMARDRNLQPPIAKQILFYPMIDDSNLTPNETIEPLAFWKTHDNVVGWTALLGDKAGDPNADVSPYAAPARAKNLTGVPPAYIDVGSLDIFRDESIAFATKLLADGVSTELHVYPGIPHAFEPIAPNIAVVRKAWQNRWDAMTSF
ncbi:triacylglycerol lipase [Fusarium albosuccineum]|uniref:Triacylglycerol lipase n=1 Tax=Fusarium albosuccineum TaxID=1237068 RepID=A0A8H4PA62_9HYPO|nr:triacylglycerol lipase [Fusarium albosuccineum]